MFPTLLITLREVIEASLIVATIVGILIKSRQKENIKTVWLASTSALLVSFLLVFGGSMIGINIQKIYSSTTEGVLYIISAFFITWAVFTLHKQFGAKKMHQLQTMKDVITKRGIFMLTFSAVLREGIEIALFLSTIYLTSSPMAVLSGFVCGILIGISISFLFVSASIRLPIFWAFRATSFLLILFAGNMLAHGVGEFPIHFMPTLPALAGLTYIFLMHRRVFVRQKNV